MIPHMVSSASKAGSVGTVETQFLDLPAPLKLDCGKTLHPVRIAYETYGTLSPARDNVILVCHALSGDAHAAGFAKTPPPESTRDGFAAEDRDGTAGRGLGWWDGMIGPGKAFDTDRFFVVSTNLLGGCRGATGPSSTKPATGKPYGSDFPVITVADMVRTERAFLDAIGIARLAAVAGGSLGAKFGRRLQSGGDIRYTLSESEFEIESYLRHQAESFVRRFDANSYLYTSRALTYFDLARQYGGGRLVDALKNVSARMLLIAFSSDWLYPPAGSEELAAALRANGKDVELHIIEAPYGHDCFLLEEARQTPMIQAFL